MADEDISVSAAGLCFHHETNEISSVEADSKSVRVGYHVTRSPVLMC